MERMINSIKEKLLLKIATTTLLIKITEELLVLAMEATMKTTMENNPKPTNNIMVAKSKISYLSLNRSVMSSLIFYANSSMDNTNAKRSIFAMQSTISTEVNAKKFTCAGSVTSVTGS